MILIGFYLENGEIKISLGEQLNGYCFIDVVVDAALLSMTDSNVSGKIFNIAFGPSVSIKEALERVVNIVGSGKPKFGAVPYTKGQNTEFYADVNSANKRSPCQLKQILMRG